MSGPNGKTLSNGTLSLRFMQNAQRSKQQATVDLQRAVVRDEREWEVSKEVREAWGLSSSPRGQTKQAVTHETSYLPFLFPSLYTNGRLSDSESEPETSTSSLKISGRRTFSRGKEVAVSTSTGTASTHPEGEQEDGVPANAQPPETDEGSTAPHNARAVPPPGVLTGARAQRLTLQGRAGRSIAPGVPVLAMISAESSAAVGLDLRRARKVKESGVEVVETSATSHVSVASAAGIGRAGTVAGKGSLGFLRPAGVDSPAAGVNKPKKRGREEEGPKGLRETEGITEGGEKTSASNPHVSGVGEESQPLVKKKKKKQKKQAETTGITTPQS
ncbi:hypothetical protein M0805_007555 [Coniferiporia weirii]|nr:hypothetical protein M0805_007555 [Coniferiporia weirii]